MLLSIIITASKKVKKNLKIFLAGKNGGEIRHFSKYSFGPIRPRPWKFIALETHKVSQGRMPLAVRTKKPKKSSKKRVSSQNLLKKPNNGRQRHVNAGSNADMLWRRVLSPQCVTENLLQARESVVNLVSREGKWKKTCYKLQ